MYGCMAYMYALQRIPANNAATMQLLCCDSNAPYTNMVYNTIYLQSFPEFVGSLKILP
jgi:hypothetical protein